MGDHESETWALTTSKFRAALNDALGAESDANAGEPAYLAVIEPVDGGFSAYLPDLLGCVAIGASLAELEEKLAAAVLVYVNGQLSDDERLPEPSAQVRRVMLRL